MYKYISIIAPATTKYGMLLIFKRPGLLTKAGISLQQNSPPYPFIQARYYNPTQQYWYTHCGRSTLKYRPLVHKGPEYGHTVLLHC